MLSPSCIVAKIVRFTSEMLMILDKGQLILQKLLNGCCKSVSMNVQPIENYYSKFVIFTVVIESVFRTALQDGSECLEYIELI